MNLNDSEKKLVLIIAGTVASVLALAVVIVAIDNYMTNRFVETQVEYAKDTFEDAFESVSESGQRLQRDLSRSADEMRRQSEVNSARRKEEAARRAAETRQRNRAMRSNTAIGKTLFRKCREYSDYLRNTPGPYARQQQQDACSSFENYLESGVAPPNR